MRFIIDTQLPPRLAKHLNQLDAFNLDAIHTTDFEDGHLLSDDQIVETAILDDRIIISKDNDFLEHYLVKGAPPKVLLLALGNIRNQDLIKYFEEHFQVIYDLFISDAELVSCTRTEIIDHSVD